MQDVYYEKSYIREDDVFQIDISRYVSLNNKPVIFSSNNSRIKLPGIVNKNSQLFLKDTSFDILDFKFDNEYMFILEKNKKKFY